MSNLYNIPFLAKNKLLGKKLYAKIQKLLKDQRLRSDTRSKRIRSLINESNIPIKYEQWLQQKFMIALMQERARCQQLLSRAEYFYEQEFGSIPIPTRSCSNCSKLKSENAKLKEEILNIKKLCAPILTVDKKDEKDEKTEFSRESSLRDTESSLRDAESSLRDTEISTLSRDIDQLSRKLVLPKKKASDKDTEISELKQQVKKFEEEKDTEISELEKDIIQKAKLIVEQNQELDRTQREHSKEITNMILIIAELRRNLSTKISECKLTQNRYADLKAKCKENDERLGQLKNDLRQEIVEFKQTNISYKGALEAKDEELQQFKEEIEQLKSVFEEANQLLKDNGISDTVVNNLKEFVALSKEFVELNQQKENLESKNQELVSNNENLLKNLENLEQSLEEEVQKCSASKNEYQELERKCKESDEQLNEVNKGLEQQIEELQQQTEELKQELQQIGVTKADLEQNTKKQAEKEIHLNKIEQSLDFRRASLDRERQSFDSRRASLDSRRASLNEKTENIKRIEQSLEQQNEELKQQTEELKQELKQIGVTKADLDRKDESLKKKEINLNFIKQNLDRIKNSLNGSKEALNNTEEILNRRNSRLKQKKEYYKSLEEKIKALQSVFEKANGLLKENGFEGEILENLQNFVKLSSKFKKLLRLQNETSARLAQCLQDEQKLTREIKNLSKEVLQREDEVDDGLDSIRIKDQQIAEKDQDIAEKDQQIAEKDREIEQKNQEIAEKKREIAEKKREIAERDQQIEQKKKEIEQKNQIIARKNEHIAEKDEDNKMKQTVFDKETIEMIENVKEIIKSPESKKEVERKSVDEVKLDDLILYKQKYWWESEKIVPGPSPDNPNRKLVLQIRREMNKEQLIRILCKKVIEELDNTLYYSNFYVPFAEILFKQFDLTWEEYNLERKKIKISNLGDVNDYMLKFYNKMQDKGISNVVIINFIDAINKNEEKILDFFRKLKNIITDLISKQKLQAECLPVINNNFAMKYLSKQVLPALDKLIESVEIYTTEKSTEYHNQIILVINPFIRAMSALPVALRNILFKECESDDFNSTEIGKLICAEPEPGLSTEDRIDQGIEILMGLEECSAPIQQ
jgi:epidermal growth factor receptor substrate 15